MTSNITTVLSKQEVGLIVGRGSSSDYQSLTGPLSQANILEALKAIYSDCSGYANVIKTYDTLLWGSNPSNGSCIDPEKWQNASLSGVLPGDQSSFTFKLDGVPSDIVSKLVSTIQVIDPAFTEAMFTRKEINKGKNRFSGSGYRFKTESGVYFDSILKTDIALTVQQLKDICDNLVDSAYGSDTLPGVGDAPDIVKVREVKPGDGVPTLSDEYQDTMDIHAKYRVTGKLYKLSMRLPKVQKGGLILTTQHVRSAMIANLSDTADITVQMWESSK